jgi:hypothetical protein
MEFRVYTDPFGRIVDASEGGAGMLTQSVRGLPIAAWIAHDTMNGFLADRAPGLWTGTGQPPISCRSRWR